MKKPDEIALFALMRASPGVLVDAGFPCEVAGDALGIPRKRVYSLLDKWADCGWWDYGVSLRSGWFTKDAPAELRP